MAIPSVDQLNYVYKQLCDERKKKIILTGERGVGKTWMATKVSDRALREKLFDITLWVFMYRKYDGWHLCRSIARQLSLPLPGEEWEDEHNMEATEAELEYMKKQISKKVRGKKCLLILDDEGSKMKETELEMLLPIDQNSCKVLITSRNKIGDDIVEVKPLPLQESLSMLKKRIQTTIHELPDAQDLAKAYIERFKGLPGATVVIANALNFFVHRDSDLLRLKSAFSELSDGESSNLLQLLCSGHDVLPSGVLIDCCWGGSHFFRDRGSVYYNELITYWILEGYLGHVSSIEEVYAKGHDVLMVLIDCGVVRELEAGYVTMDRQMLDLGDYHRNGFSKAASLGLATFDCMWRGMGKIIKRDGVMKAFSKSEQGQALTTLLLDGNHFQKETDLQVLALFNSTFTLLPEPLSDIANIRVLVLRECRYLKDISPTLRLSSLTVLEISGSISLNMVPDDFFKGMPLLRSLNFSKLQIKSLPSSLFNLGGLRWLILRRCTHLKELKSLSGLKNLMVLDLSGSTSFTSFTGTLEDNRQLQILDLSETKIRVLPFLKNLNKLTHLVLSDCAELHRLPFIKMLTSLQILDISGAKVFKLFLDSSLQSLVNLKVLDLSGANGLEGIAKGFFDKLKYLQSLNLSGTNVKSLPALSDLCNLRQLLLSRCVSLLKLPELSNLSKLEVLDLSDCTSLEVKQDVSSDHRPDIQKMEDPNVTVCGADGWNEVENGPFDNLKCLRVLNLSGTNFSSLPSLSNLCSLRQLLLSRCASLLKLPELNNLTKLEVLDLSGCNSLADIADLSFEHMPHLKKVNHHKATIHGAGNRDMKGPGDDLTQQEWFISNWRAAGAFPETVPVTNTKFFELLEKDPLLLKSKIKQFHFLIHPKGAQYENGNKELYRHELIFRDTCFQSRQIPSQAEQVRSLEVRGFLGLPKGVEDVIQHAESVFLTDNLFIRSLSDLGAANIKKMKVCWIERCSKLESVVHFLQSKDSFESERMEERTKLEEKVGWSANFGESLEILWVSNLLNLKGMQSGNLQRNSLKNLKFLHLDYCPRLKIVFFTSQSLENLERLEVKFCPELETLFEDELAALPKLHTMHLWGLPKLNKVGGMAPALHSLEVGECSKLINIFCPSQLPINLKLLHIKSCDNMDTVLEQRSSTDQSLPKLLTLHLCKLPKLRSIGVLMPSLETLDVRECPKLPSSS